MLTSPSLSQKSVSEQLQSPFAGHYGNCDWRQRNPCKVFKVDCAIMALRLQGKSCKRFFFKSINTLKCFVVICSKICIIEIFMPVLLYKWFV